jgi:hypothetical protein
MKSDDIMWIIKNWDRIPDKFKTYLKPQKWSNNIDGLKSDEHFVILLINRQKPSIECCYDFDEERIGVTRTGKIVWGFDSGCSCPIPWDDSYPDWANVSATWKEFIIAVPIRKEGEDVYGKFDFGIMEEADKKLIEIKASLSPKTNEKEELK